MRIRNPFSALRSIPFLLLLTATILTIWQLAYFRQARARLPAGLKIAGIPVGELARQQAAQRLLGVYSLPVELHYKGYPIHLNPAAVSFQLDVEQMLASAGHPPTQTDFWKDFWDYLSGRPSPSSPDEISLQATYSETRLRAYLEELAKIYDLAPQAAIPIAGSVSFEPGKPGYSLYIEASVGLIETALFSITDRYVDLPIHYIDPPAPSFNNLNPSCHHG